MSGLKKAATLQEIAKMAAELCGNPDAEQGVLDHARRVRIISMLEMARVVKGWSPREMARKMGCTPYRLNRMEASADADLRLGDIVAYAKALGVDMSIVFNSEEFPESRPVQFAAKPKPEARALRPQTRALKPQPRMPRPKVCERELEHAYA